jgi:hypothetical protein
MGYTTDFEGKFTVSPALTADQVAYLKRFCESRRMRRDAAAVERLPDELRVAVGLPVGTEGGYFVGAGGFMGQERSPDVLDYNDPPSGQPSLWCKWEPSDDGLSIAWNGAEKFYAYTEWLNYLIDHFLRPWGVTISGHVKYQGEEVGDCGRVEIVDGQAVQLRARL